MLQTQFCAFLGLKEPRMNTNEHFYPDNIRNTRLACPERS